MHSSFKDFLKRISVPEKFYEPLLIQMEMIYKYENREKKWMVKLLRSNHTQLEEKYEIIEEQMVLGEIDRDTADKYLLKYRREMENIEIQLDEISNLLSGGSEIAGSAIQLLVNVEDTWERSSYVDKRRLQELLFPARLQYKHKKDEYRTEDLNPDLHLIVTFTDRLRKKKRGQKKRKSLFAPDCTRGGFR